MANFIDKANQILQNVLNYIQEGLKQEGFDVDFQSTTDQPCQNNQAGCVQAYPPHPNVDSNHDNLNSQETFTNINTKKQ